MYAQKLYDFLNELRKKESKYEKDTIRLFSFIYGEAYQYICDLEENSSYDSDLKEVFESFIDDDDSCILNNYIKMINDDNKQFIEKFFDKVNSTFDFMDNKLYRSNDFSPYLYVFNIYFMLKTYNEYKNNFEVYSKYVDLFSKFISGSLEDYCDDFLLSEKKEVIDKILEAKCTSDFPVLDLKLKELYDSFFDDSSELNIDDEKMESFCDFLSTSLVLKDEANFNKDTFSYIFNCFFDDDIDSKYVYYSPILLFGDRYQYFEDIIDVVGDDDVTNEILEYISSLDYRMFNELDNEKDSFIEIMNIIFDSDTFYEMECKFIDLGEASEIYTSSGMNKDVFNLIKGLNSEEHKKKIDGVTLTYLGNSINKVEKPYTILDRTEDLIKLHFNISLDADYGCCFTMSDFDDALDSYVYNILEQKKNEKNVVSASVDVGSNLSLLDVELNNNGEESKEEVKVGFSKVKSLFGKRK